MVFPVVIYGCERWKLDHRQSWASENWCFWTAVLEKTLESPLDCKEIKPVNTQENQFGMFIGRTDPEAETPILWLPDAKNWLIGKIPVAGKDWRQEEKGAAEDKMVGWHHQLNGHEFEQVPGVGDGQGGLACCSPWGCKESDMTERLNWTELNWTEGAVVSFPGGSSGKESTCQCRRHKGRGFHPWVRKSTWRRALQPTPVFLPGESYGQSNPTGCCLWGHKELDTTEWLTLHFTFKE